MVVYPDSMPIAEKSVRQSIILPAYVARQVMSLELADHLLRSRAPKEQKRLKEELARMTFGE
jgi:hypothetical protein